MIRRLSLLACLGLMSLAAVPLGAAEPSGSPPQYRIYPLRNGVCKVAGHHAFFGGDPKEVYGFSLYIWLVLGGEKPMLVEAGINDVAEMNRGAAHVLAEPITQPPEESAPAQLRKFGLEPEDISRIFVTHLHFDHVDGLDDFPNAIVHIGRREWEDGRAIWAHGRVKDKFLNDPQWKKRLALVDDEEILPGIESFWIGGHTPGSTAYRINTAYGRAVLTGDTISIMGNMKVPAGVYSDIEQVKAAMKTVAAKADIVLPSHDPDNLRNWPPVPAGAPKYTIKAIKVGDCAVRNEVTFHDAKEDRKTRTFNLYAFAILGGEKPMIVETGPNPRYVEEFNRSTEAYIPGGIKQKPDENTLVALRKAGIDPAEVSHVIITHTHADHYDYFPAFPNAKLVINKTELQDNLHRLNPDVLSAITSREGAVQIVGDEEIVPGVRAVPLGCHTSGSQGVLVRTWMGPVILTGDTVYLYDNIEGNRPTRSPDPRACFEAMTRIRSLADIVVPAHDPETLERWPGGVIGGLPEEK